LYNKFNVQSHLLSLYFSCGELIIQYEVLCTFFVFISKSCKVVIL
jgi:hypothetical protein